MKIVLIIFCSILTSLLWAAECFVISGAKHDKNNFLHSRKIFTPETSMIGGQKCTVVTSWSELVKSIQEKKIPQGTSLMVIQGAHGSRRLDDNGNLKVAFSCDADEPSASDVLGHLNALAQKYQVGAAIHSCYSGEIMKQKLIQDEGSEKNLDKLCLYTSSSMGRITYGHEQDIIKQLEMAKKGQSLEELFLKVPNGMISSAAWSEIALPQYFMSQTAEDGFATLQNLDKITRADFSCNNMSAANTALCAAPGVTDEIYRDLMIFQNPIIPSSIKKDFVQDFEKKISDADKTLKINSQDKVAKAKRACFTFVLKTYQQHAGPNLEGVETWDLVRPVTDVLAADPNFAQCEIYHKSLKVEGFSAKDMIEGKLYLGALDYRVAIDSLQRRYSKRKMDESFDIKDFARAAMGEKKVCDPNDKVGIIQSMFGDAFFESEYFDDEGLKGEEMINNKKVSTQLALKAFQNASVMKTDVPDVKDQKRREACRKFKF